MHLTCRRSSESGFTLVELLVVLGLISVIGAIITPSLVRGMTVTRQASDRVATLAELARGIERMGRELRAADPLLVATDGDVEAVVYRGGRRLRYRYTLTGSTLTQTLLTYPDATAATPSSTTSTVLLDGLDQTGRTTFAYAKAGGEPWVAGSDALALITTVTVSLAGDLLEQANPIVVETAVHLRNS